VAGHQHATRRLGGICPLQHRVDVLNARVLEDAGVRLARFDKVVALDLEAAAALLRDAGELGEDPVGGRSDAGAGGKIGVHAGERGAVAERDQFSDVIVNLVGRDPGDRRGDGGIGGRNRERLLRVRNGGKERGQQQKRGGVYLFCHRHPGMKVLVRGGDSRYNVDEPIINACPRGLSRSTRKNHGRETPIRKRLSYSSDGPVAGGH